MIGIRRDAMQTLISVFDDRQSARRAVEKLVADGFSRRDVHLQEPPAAGVPDAQAEMRAAAEEDRQNRELGELTMHTPEREVAVDRGVLEAIGHFFTSLMGKDHQRHAGRYSEAVKRGCCVVAVDAKDDAQAEHAAMLLHECGAVDVDDRAQQWKREGWEGEAKLDGRDASRPGVRQFTRDVPLRDVVAQRRASEDATGAGTRRYANPEPKPETLEDRAARVANERAFAFGDGPRNEARDAHGKPSRGER
jgi:hypothetical protein